LAVAVAAASAQASTVYILDTGASTAVGGVLASNWTVNRTIAPSGSTVDYGSVVPYYNGAWISPAIVDSDAAALDGQVHNQAGWVSSSSSTDQDTNGTKYVYTDTFSVPNSFSGENYDLKAYVSTDNWFDWADSTITFTAAGGHPTSTFHLSDYLVPLNGGNTGNERTFAIDIKLDSSSMGTVGYPAPTAVELNFDVINSYGGATPGSGPNPGPTGFILAGSLTATPVPLPAAAWLGFSMLGGMGLLAKLRKRKQSSL